MLDLVRFPCLPTMQALTFFINVEFEVPVRNDDAEVYPIRVVFMARVGLYLLITSDIS